MNKFSKLLVVSLAIISFPAFAQSAFEGFYGQIATGYENNSVANTGLTMTDPATPSDGLAFPGGNNPTSSTAPIVIGLGYNHTLSSSFLMGFGVDYSVLQTNVGNSWINGANSGEVNYKVSNRLNLFVTPTYIVDNSAIAYAKIGYSTQTVKAQYTNGAESANGSSMGSGNASGYVLGLGYKQMIYGGFYGFGEANYYSYSKVTLNSQLTDTTLITNFSPSTSAYNFLIGIGYKF